MTLEELKAQYPALYALAVAEGVTQGTTEERDRVEAHLTLGESSGDMKTALEAVASGDGLTAKLTAKYMAAGMNRASTEDHLEEDPDTGAPDAKSKDDIKPDAKADAEADAVADAVAASMGGVI